MLPLLLQPAVWCRADCLALPQPLLFGRDRSPLLLQKKCRSPVATTPPPRAITTLPPRTITTPPPRAIAGSEYWAEIH
jgi:hypothetical protein